MIYLAMIGYTVSCLGKVQLGGLDPWYNRVGPALVFTALLPLKLDYLVVLRLLKISPLNLNHLATYSDCVRPELWV